MRIIVSNFLLPTFSTVKGLFLLSQFRYSIGERIKFKRRDQGLLGVVNIQVANYLDLKLGGHGTFSSLGVAYPLPPPRLTNVLLIVLVQLDLKGSNDNLVVQGKLVIYLSTIPSTTATSSRPAGSSLALTLLPSYDSNHSVNNYSVNNASVYTASVNGASVSELHSSSISLSRTLSSHTTSESAEVTTPIMAVPTTIIPGTDLEQQQSLPNISTRTASSDGTSTVDHPQNAPRPSAPGNVSPGQPITDAQHNLNANEDQYGPLPEGWKSGIDPLGLTYEMDQLSEGFFQAMNHANCAAPFSG